MDLYEYQARNLFRQHGVPVLDGAVATTPEEARSAAQSLLDAGSELVVVKAQVKTGGRGKAGGVKLARTAEEAEARARDILGMDIKGHTVHKVMIAQGAKIAEEYYFSILLDRANRSYLAMCSKEGGMEIEQLAVERPEALARIEVDPNVGIDEAKAKEIVEAAKFDAETGAKIITVPDLRWKRRDIKSVALLAQVLAKQQAAAIAANREGLEQDGFSFVAGNPDGAITVVEFFDYRCPYCKQVAEDMTKLIERHDDVRLVLKEFPILGPNSTIASEAAIAAIPQGKYLDFHFALLESKGTLDRAKVMEIAEAEGLDTDKLARDMESARVDRIIDTNHDLAREIGVRGTPAFVIGDSLIPGAASIEEIEARIQAVRDAAKAG